MEISKGHHYLSSNKFDCRLHEPLHLENIVVNVSSWQIFEEKVDPKFVLKYKIHGIYEWVICLEQDLLLILYILHLLFLQQ